MTTLHIDADLIPYLVANSEYSHCIINNKLKQFSEIQDKLGLDMITLHVGSKSKGGRELFPFYQSNRKKPTPELRDSLESTRRHIASLDGACIQGKRWFDREADDGIRLTYKPGDYIWSKDKDLRMIAGNHVDLDPYKCWATTELGGLLKLSKGIWGCGNLWFWFQMLVGDRVDGIHPVIKGMGPMTAFKVLQNVTSEREAMGEVLKYTPDFHTLFSRGFCLWLRRTESHLDFLDYITELGYPPKHAEGLAILRAYEELKAAKEQEEEEEPLALKGNNLNKTITTKPLTLFGIDL